MKYVAWYTENTVYEDLFHQMLEPTLTTYGLESYIVVMPNLQKWGANVAQKPLVVLSAIDALKEPFVLLDVDCKITGEPTLFETIDKDKYDIAYHLLDWKTWYNRPHETRKELLTGTMWINSNIATRTMIAAWAKHCSANPGADQPPLEYLMNHQYNNLRIFELPLEYVWIDSLPNGDKPHVKPNGEVIIRHFQASRECKRKIL
jgi:hypothetical protein